MRKGLRQHQGGEIFSNVQKVLILMGNVGRLSQKMLGREKGKKREKRNPHSYSVKTKKHKKKKKKTTRQLDQGGRGLFFLTWKLGP